MCKALQEGEVCTVAALGAMLRTRKAIESLKDVDFKDLPTVKKVLARIQQSDEGSTYMYQGTKLTRYSEGVTFLQSHKNEYVESVISCLRERVKVQHCNILTHTLALLATQGWEKPENIALFDVALESLVSHFKAPLEKSGVNISAISEEWEDMLAYAKQYLSLVQDDYRTVWWKLFNAANSTKWANILSLVELLFCFPMTNGHLERVFSSLKLIKTDHRCSLGEDRLDHLVHIAVDGPPLSQWDATDAVRLWWKSKQRRQIPDSRAAPTPTTSRSADTGTETETYTLNLQDWDIICSLIYQCYTFICHVII